MGALSLIMKADARLVGASKALPSQGAERVCELDDLCGLARVVVLTEQ